MAWRGVKNLRASCWQWEAVLDNSTGCHHVPDSVCSPPRLLGLIPPDFDANWLKICMSTFILLCLIYSSSNSTKIAQFSEYLNSYHEAVLFFHSLAQVLYAGDFTVHHKLWLFFSQADKGVMGVYTFSVLNDLEQLIRHQTRFPNQTSYRLELCFSSNPLRCSCKTSSYRTLITSSSLVTPLSSPLNSTTAVWEGSAD